MTLQENTVYNSKMDGVNESDGLYVRFQKQLEIYLWRCYVQQELCKLSTIDQHIFSIVK